MSAGQCSWEGLAFVGNLDKSILPKEKIIADLCSRESEAVLDFQNRFKTKGLTAKKMNGKVFFL